MNWKRALALVLAALVALALFLPPFGKPGPLPPLRHGVWLDRHWLRGDRTEADMAAMLTQMAEAGAVYLFIHAGPFNPDGTIPPYSPERAALLKRLTRGRFHLSAWLGGLNAAAGGDLDLMSATNRRRAAAAAAQLVADGFDGVHINIEPTPDGDPGFLLLLGDVRESLPDGALLSAATNLGGPWWVPNRFLFTEPYIREVAKRADQIAVMNYDTYAPTRALYRRISAAQVTMTLRAVAEAKASTRVLIGVPAYPTEGGLRHWAAVENTAAALAGIRSGLGSTAPDHLQRFEGAALYAGWTATESDWRLIGDWRPAN